MPIIKSAKKALRVSRERKAFNDITRSKVKSAIKGVKMAVKNSDEAVATLLDKAYKELDTAAKKIVIHKNKASRLKSRLAKAVAKNVITPVAKKAKKKAARPKTKK